MSSYAISNPALNPNRVFILQKSELEKRFDPFFYSPLNRLKILEKTNLPKKKLSDVAELKRGKFSHRPRNDERFFGGDYPFIQTGEIVQASKNYGKIQYSQTLNELGLSVSKLFEKDVLLITIAANIGDTAILDYPACFPDSIVAISSKDENVSLKYLNVYFKFLKKYLENLAPSAAQKNLTLEQLAPTPVILPSVENQNKIVEIFDNYIFQKQTNEVEAEKLLASIDDYLLGELGISLPTPPENTLKNRMFTTSIKEISGGRFDPTYHKVRFHKLMDAITNSNHNYVKLGDEIDEINYGASFSNTYVESGIPLLRIRDLRRNEIVLDKVVFLPNDVRKQLGNSFVKQNDFLISRSGTIGVVSIVAKPIEGFAFGSFMIKFNLKSENIFNKEFLSYYLNCKLLIELIEREKIGAIQGNITIPIIKSLPIPTPPLSKQKEIAEHITNIRNQAQSLKDKTKDLLKKASAEIEEILLN